MNWGSTKAERPCCRLALLALATMLAACDTSNPPIFFHPDAELVPEPEQAVIRWRTTKADLTSIDGTPQGELRRAPGRSLGVAELRLGPGRHSIVVENRCLSARNTAYARITMRFETGAAYTISGAESGFFDTKCVVGLVEEPGGQVICEVETGSEDPSFRLVSRLRYPDGICQGWSGNFLQPMAPQDIDDAAWLTSYSHNYFTLAMASWREMREVVRRQLSAFVVPFAEGFAGDPEGVVAGHGVFVDHFWQWPPSARESKYVRIQAGPPISQRSYLIVFVFSDAAALARFEDRLDGGQPLTLEPEPGLLVRAWTRQGPPAQANQ